MWKDCSRLVPGLILYELGFDELVAQPGAQGAMMASMSHLLKPSVAVRTVWRSLDGLSLSRLVNVDMLTLDVYWRGLSVNTDIPRPEVEV